MKKYLMIFAAVIFAGSAVAQEIPINTSDLETLCGGAVLDTGANPGPYGNNESHSITVCPEDGTVTNLYSPFFDLGAGDEIVIYDGDSNTAPILGTYTGNDLQNQSIVASNTNASGCLTIEFTSDASEVGNFAFVIDCGPPCDRPISGITTDQEQPHRICPGETVDFSAASTVVADGFSLVSYEWNFDDGTPFVDGGEDISHTFDEPGIYFVNLNVEDDNECTNANRVDFRVEVSNDPEWLSDQGNFSLCLGEEVELMNMAIPVTYIDQPGANLGGDLFIPDDQTTCFSSEIIFGAFESTQIVDEVGDIDDFFINFEHSYMGDLVITFICPNGQSIAVHQQSGGSTYLGEPIDDESDVPGVGFDYFWSPDATNGTWAEESAGVSTLPSGTYSSVDDWENLIGCPLNGTWTVEICDLFGVDNGFIFDWTVNIDPENYPDAAQFTPTFGLECDSTAWADGPFITNTSDDCNTISLLAETEGTYQYYFEATNNFGCTYVDTVDLEVLAPFDPGLNGQSLECEAVTGLQLFDLLNGSPDAGGVWTSPGDELVPNGVYNGNLGEGDFEYTVTGPGSCPPSSSLVSIDLALLGNPGSNNTLYLCEESSAADLFPLLGDADQGGTWQDPNGNDFNGVFNPASDEEGIYTYAVPSEDPCPAVVAEVLAITVPSPLPELDDESYFCGIPLTLTGELSNGVPGADYSYVWGPTDVTAGQTGTSVTVNNIENDTEITFTATLDGFPECSNTVSATVFAPEPPSTSIDSLAYELCLGETVALPPPIQSEDWDYIYSWTFLNDVDTAEVEFIGLEPSITVDNSGFYQLTITSDDPCANSAIQNYVVETVVCEIFIPNIITPFDQDGKNDAFAITGIDFFPGSRMVIYNRWGNIVYEEDGYNSSNYWRPREGEVSDGTYYYILELNRRQGDDEVYSGIVTVAN